MTDRTDAAAPPSPPGRILIVDDEPFNVDYLEQELESRGYVTESASNGQKALERIAASAPDLVLLDVMMPELDGIATLRILKQDPETRLIPVVLMTALNSVDDRVRGIEAGADDFLSKPVDDRELLARIRTAINAKRAVDDAVGELRTTSAHLERFGMQARDVAILAVEWRTDDASVEDDAVGFVARRQRDAAENMIATFAGLVSDLADDRGVLVAVFDGADVRRRSITAVEAAGAVLDATADTGHDPPTLGASAAVTVGRATVGSRRVVHGTTTLWAWGAEGDPVELASTLAHGAATGAVVVAGDVAVVVGDRFPIAPVGNDVFSIRVGGGGAPRPPSSRFVTTILVTDVVGSTRTFERVGDRAGGELLAAHERVTRAELVVHGGREINAVGDGFLAAFGSPASAIRCAFAVNDRVRELGLVIRAGVHTGELETVDGTARGIAMHVASRIAGRAAPGEVLVSSTTRELVANAGLRFFDRGEHHLKGLSEPRQLFAAKPATESTTSSEVSTTDVESYPAGLTAREVDVLRLVAVGQSDAQVAEQLFVSVRTVHAHLRSIYRKAGLSSRAAAVRFADEHGLL
jgi:DNA-binding NarL/FixJ family response regulator